MAPPSRRSAAALPLSLALLPLAAASSSAERRQLPPTQQGWHAPGELKADGSFFNKKFSPDGGKPAAIPAGGTPGSPKLFTYRVLSEHDHDPAAFTQGLLCSDKPDCSTFYESTGLYGHTEVREVERETGNVLRRQSNIPKKYFGEGLVRWKDEFTLLTWKTNIGLVYDAGTLECAPAPAPPCLPRCRRTLTGAGRAASSARFGRR